MYFRQLRLPDIVHRDQAIQPHLERLVDHPHPAFAEFLQDLVMRDGAASRRDELRSHRTFYPL